MSDSNGKIKLFESQHVRTEWDDDGEKWWFSVVDIVAVLTEQPDYTRARKYWSVLKRRLKNEGSQLATNCSQLKLTAADGKKYLTDMVYKTWADKTAKQMQLLSKANKTYA